MLTNKRYILAFVLFLLGIFIGWLLPSKSNHEHRIENSENNSTASSTPSGETWTCSMHPQIRQNEPGICPICEMDLIPMVKDMDNQDPTILKMTQEAVNLAQVETFRIGGSSVNPAFANSTISVDGTIELNESTIKSQTAHIAGRIENMSVNYEGQYVAKGQKIASVYSTELLAASQELITATKFNDRMNGIQEASIQKLKNWKISDDVIQSIIQSQQPIETIDIYADHSGYVMRKILSQGDYVKQGQSLYSVGSLNDVWLVFNVFESDMDKIKIGSEVVFTTPSLPNQEFRTKISYIEPLLNSTSRTAVVRAEFVNKGNKLKPGMLLKGSIQANTNSRVKSDKTTFSIPNSSILWTGKKSVVYVQLEPYETPTFQYREVTIERRDENYSIVSDGLKEGEQIISHGAFAIDAAAQLNNNMSMMNKNVQVKKTESPDVVPSFSEVVTDEFNAQFDLVVNRYIDLKDALVRTSADEASLESDLLLKSLQGVDPAQLKGAANEFWTTQSQAIKEHATLIKNNSSIEEQRNQFDFLSQAMIRSLKAFGSNGHTYYVQYCPMAKGNNGADWIAREEEIRNPYFGDKMMKCGLVKIELN